MNPAQLLLRYQAQVDQELGVREVIERLESRLASDPEVVELEDAMQEAKAAQDVVAARLRESDRTAFGFREFLTARRSDRFQSAQRPSNCAPPPTLRCAGPAGRTLATAIRCSGGRRDALGGGHAGRGKGPFGG